MATMGSGARRISDSAVGRRDWRLRAGVALVAKAARCPCLSLRRTRKKIATRGGTAVAITTRASLELNQTEIELTPQASAARPVMAALLFCSIIQSDCARLASVVATAFLLAFSVPKRSPRIRLIRNPLSAIRNRTIPVSNRYRCHLAPAPGQAPARDQHPRPPRHPHPSRIFRGALSRSTCKAKEQ